jgi:hypothetical protein
MQYRIDYLADGTRAMQTLQAPHAAAAVQAASATCISQDASFELLSVLLDEDHATDTHTRPAHSWAARESGRS